MAENQPFDNFAREFALRIELLRAVGEFTKAQADANLTNARALDQVERTKTTREINQSLRRALREIEVAEHRAKTEQAIAERRVEQLQYIVQGRKPLDLATFHARVEAISWMISRGKDSAALFEELPEECLSVGNFVSLSQVHPDPEAPPKHVGNLAELVVWMRERLNYFAAGSELHERIAGVVDALAATQAALVAEIQAKLDLARGGTYQKLGELRKFLKLEGG